jgi:hypothetical protein
MFVNIVLALIIFFLANTFKVIVGHPYVNFALWALIVFVVLGVFYTRVPPPQQNRNYWLW